jgi:arylsulfatase A-like enzyme
MSGEKRAAVTRLLAWTVVLGLMTGLLLGAARGLAAVRSNAYIGRGLGGAALYTFQSVFNSRAAPVVIAAAALGLIILVSARASRSARSAGRLAGGLAGLALGLRLGYGLNRWEFKQQWLAQRSFWGLPLRAGLFEREVLLANAGIAALSVVLAYVIYRLVSALLEALARRRALPPRVPGLAAWLAVAICLMVGLNVYAHLHRLSNGRGRPNVILISLDTLRADHVGCYGHFRDTTPNLDRIAGGAVVFEEAFAQAASTLPSHKSLFTSLYPPSLRSEGRYMLDPRRVTLAEILLDKGYLTAGFAHGLGWVTPVFGFDQGFDTYVIPSRRLIPRASTAEVVTDNAISWVRAKRDRPFFLFLHYGDIHSDWGRLPYDAPDPYRSRYLEASAMCQDDITTRMSGSLYLAEVNRGRFCPSAEELEALGALYDAGVTYTDEQVGRLHSALEDMGLAEDALIIILSDHGERFGEHGKVLHGWVTCEVARVPLIIKFPGSSLAGRRVPGRVQLVDVVPTVLEFLGLDRLPEMCGESMMTVIEEGGTTGPAFTEAGRCYAMRSGDWMFAHDFESGERQVYSLRNDPQETTNLAGLYPEREKALGTELAAWLERAEADKLGESEGERARVDESLRHLLESLGYINAGQ